MTRIRFGCAVAIAAMQLLSQAGCSNPSNATPVQSIRTSHRITWLISEAALRLLGSDPVVEKTFNNDHTYLVVANGANMFPRGWLAQPTAAFTSYAQLSVAVESGRVAPTTRAVIYDNEGWDFTPEEEQKDPARWEAASATVAHSHSMKLISSPGVSLVNAISPGGGNNIQRYLDMGLARDAAGVADIIDIQAQGSERNTANYDDFVRKAAAQARQANPNVIVLAGLSTNPPGGSVNGDQLIRVVGDTVNDVDGYWLNVPEPGPHCPQCGAANPAAGLQLLHALN